MYYEDDTMVFISMLEEKEMCSEEEKFVKSAKEYMTFLRNEMENNKDTIDKCRKEMHRIHEDYRLIQSEIDHIKKEQEINEYKENERIFFEKMRIREQEV